MPWLGVLFFVRRGLRDEHQLWWREIERLIIARVVAGVRPCVLDDCVSTFLHLESRQSARASTDRFDAEPGA